MALCSVPAVALSLGLACGPAAAAPDDPVISVVLENDVFAGFDDDYTNGIQVSYLARPDLLPRWMHEAAEMFPLFPKGATVRTTFALGQAMYTPSDITLRNPPQDDRPYAGWLYGAVGLIAENGRELDQLQLQLGVVGPASLADRTQTEWHDIIGSDTPRGWSTQLKNEPAAVLTYQRSWRAFVAGEAFGFSFDATPHVGGALGNVFTYLNAGATLRVGVNLPNDYGPPRIQPSLPGNGFFQPRADLGIYLFAGLDGRAMARNIFLDGNTFADSRDVDKHLLVGDAQVGVAVTWRNVRLAYTHVLRTEEFEGQGGEDAFGALSLSMQF
jgi:hypothetical protein